MSSTDHRSRPSVPLRAGRRRLRPSLTCLVCGGALFLSGCATIGHDFPVAEVSRIETGATSQEEIRRRFGDPWRVGVEDGETTWTYGKYKYRLFGQPSTTDLVIRFDPQGRVTSYSFSTTEHQEKR